MVLGGEQLECCVGGKGGSTGGAALFYKHGHFIPLAEARPSGHRFWQVGRGGSEGKWKLSFEFFRFLREVTASSPTDSATSVENGRCMRKILYRRERRYDVVVQENRIMNGLMSETGNKSWLCY